MGTFHNDAEKGDIAEIVIMPGDPLRAQFIAENFLTDIKQINKVRNMFGYTGMYKGKRVTTMASGMGMPSMGIYAYELYTYYDVKKIIRAGSCGGYSEDLKILDVILVDKAYSESNFAYTMSGVKDNLIEASLNLTNAIEEKSKEINIPVVKGTIMTTDCFDLYMEDAKEVFARIPKGINVIGSEMEAFALFHVAKRLNKEAACLVSVVDDCIKHEHTTTEERHKALKKMIELALETV